MSKAALALPRVGLGAAPLGNLYSAVTEDEAHGIVMACLDLGVRYFDTAPLYGYGLSEQRLGRAMRARVEDKVIISTKVGRLLRPRNPSSQVQYRPGEEVFEDAPPLRPVSDFSYRGVIQSFEESCERLGRQSVDILLLHDPEQHLEEASAGAYKALTELRSSGRIKAIGGGMNETAGLKALVQKCDLDIVLVAGRYTLLDQSALDGLLQTCASRGTAVVVGGVFNSGVLAQPSPGACFDYAPAPEHVRARALRLAEVCSHYDVPLPAAALQFPFAHPAVTSVLIGCRSVNELQTDLSWLEMEVPTALWVDLRESGLLPAGVPLPGEA